MYPNMQTMSELFKGIGTNDFNQNFYDFTKDLFQAKHSIVFRIGKGEEVPQCLLAEAQHSQTKSLVRTLAQEYTEGAYTQDPNLIESQFQPIGSPMIRCVNPTSVHDAGYRRRFYDEASVKQELAIIAPGEKETLYMCFMRTIDQKSYTDSDISNLNQMREVLINAVQKHVEVMGLKTTEKSRISAIPEGMNPKRRQKLYEDIRAALSYHPAGLTRREVEVCASIALGYTTLGISLNLGISINTVATHRKRAYSKLKISSQNELFAQYIGQLESVA